MKISISIVLIISLAFYHSNCLQIQHSQQIKCDSQCVSAYNSVTKQKTYRYVIYQIQDDSQTFVPIKFGNRNQNWLDFQDSLPYNQCRYAFYDLNQDNEENPQKILYVVWASNAAKVKEIMKYAQRKDRLVQTFPFRGKKVYVGEKSQLNLDQIRKRNRI